MIKHDEIRLRHMIEAAREAVSFAHGRIRGDLEVDRQLVLSLVKDIEIIGEAATQITERLAWNWQTFLGPKIIAMRNRLVHAYFSINLDIVWQTVQEDLPTLITNIERLVPPESGHDE